MNNNKNNTVLECLSTTSLSYSLYNYKGCPQSQTFTEERFCEISEVNSREQTHNDGCRI